MKIRRVYLTKPIRFKKKKLILKIKHFYTKKGLLLIACALVVN